MRSPVSSYIGLGRSGVKRENTMDHDHKWRQMDVTSPGTGWGEGGILQVPLHLEQTPSCHGATAPVVCVPAPS